MEIERPIVAGGISKIHILSVDALIEIFTVLTDVPDDYPHDFQRARNPNASPMPLLLGSVCQKWRHISFETPSLWRKLEIKFSNKNQHAQLDLLQDWIRRSGNQPLNLLLDHSDPHFQPVDAYSLLVSTWSRWRTLDFIGQSSDNHLRELLHSKQYSFPLLSFVGLACSSCDNDVASSFHDAPQLRTLNCTTVTPARRGHSLSKFGFNWSIIEDATLYFEFHDCLLVLDAASHSIRKASFTFYKFIDHSDVFSVPTLPVCIPLLEELELLVPKENVTGALHLGMFFQALILPSLKTLKAECQSQAFIQAGAISRLTQLLQRSCCPLQTLILRDCAEYESEILNLLCQLDHLASLTLHTDSRPPRMHFTDRILNALDLSIRRPDYARFSSGSHILPELKELRIDGFGTFSPEVVKAMLKSRIEEQHDGFQTLMLCHVVARADLSASYGWAKQLAEHYDRLGAIVQIESKP